NQIALRRWAPKQRVTAKGQLKIHEVGFQVAFVEPGFKRMVKEWITPDNHFRFEVRGKVIRQRHPGDRAQTQGEIVAIGKTFVEAKHALQIRRQTTAIAQHKLIPGKHGVELDFGQGGKEDSLGTPRSVEEADLLQFVFEVPREIFEYLVEKGLLTLRRV